MLNKKTIAMVAIALSSVPLSSAAEIKGVQAVLLHCWSQNSVQAFTNAVNASASIAFAISSAPYISQDRGCDMPTSSRLENLVTTINAIPTVPLHLIIYAGGLHDVTLGDSDLSGNFWQIWSKVIKPNIDNTRITFLVGASLEDNYRNSDGELPNDTIQALVDGIRRRRGEADESLAKQRLTLLMGLIATKRFQFTRSPITAPKVPPVPQVFIRFPLVSIWVPVLQEIHGGASKSGYQIWSNDGPLVKYDEGEYSGKTPRRREMCSKCTEFGPDIALTDFSRAASGGYHLLWRPAYNLFTTDASGDVYSFPANKGKDRIDGDNSGFTPKEAKVLKRFLTPQ